MSTYGEIRHRLSQLVPGVSLDLLDGWIMDRYQQMLDRLSWSRMEGQYVVQIPAEVNAGTVAVTNGSIAITGTGTAWATEMTGRLLRINAETGFYEFTWLTATTGTLDRNYEGATAASLSYRLNQNVVQLPAAVRLVRNVRGISTGLPLERFSVSQLDTSFPARNGYGAPTAWAPYFDRAVSPPVQQIELYPIPEELTSILVAYVAESGELAEGDTSTSLFPWMRPACLIAGVHADAAAHLKDYDCAQRQDARFEVLLADMVRTECTRRGQVRMQPANWMVAHQSRRYTR